jgi:NAD(P)-dependent dehydrogenase (short-subunit alcohol dehydrogenase family)
MRLCEGRVAIVTGAGRGVGRAYAEMLARHGAKVVVNDIGSAPDGRERSASPAEEAVEAIRAAGGEAIADSCDVSDWSGASEMIQRTIASFGRLDILINNAGILRDRMLVNLSEDDWDAVIRVHLKGTFAPLHHAANHWRLRSKAGDAVDARVINTTSHSALFGNIGQANYAAAKGGIAALTVVAARELKRIGVTVNAVAPRANTRLTEGLREYSEEEKSRRAPEWVAALVTWLSSPEAAHVSGRVFEAWGYGFGIAEGWQHGPMAEASRNPEDIGARINEILAHARGNAGIERDTWCNP